VGSYNWGGFYYTTFVIDPKEDLIAIFLGQMNPSGGLNLDSKAMMLAYQAIKD
jgi:CubicO group peptidase (beta-lactamase class C family)